VSPAGELDLASAPQLAEALREAQKAAPLVAVDLRELVFMDCAGLHAIEHALRRAEETGGRLTVVRGPRQVDLILAFAEAQELFDVVDLGPAEPPVQALLRLDSAETA
jgi:anti-anti-sigma factor